MEKTASKRWRESGSTLTFKEWINRENQKKTPADGTFIPFDGLTINTSSVTDGIKQTLSQGAADLQASSGLKVVTNGTFFGLDTGVLVVSALLVTGALVYYFHQQNAK